MNHPYIPLEEESLGSSKLFLRISGDPEYKPPKAPKRKTFLVIMNILAS